MVKDEKMIEKEKIEEKKKPNVIEPYKPLVPFPQRLAQAKLEKKYGKFLDILKKLPINIPFLDAISEMPSYAKFLKDMLSNKRKIEENATVSLTAECSAILQNKLQKKLGDPGSYSIPVKLGDIEIKKALYDLGASVSLMPLSICKKLQMGELKPTRISLQLANRSVRFPFGILEDVPLIVGKFFILCDFMVMEMEEDEQVLIIPGRPLLATARATINMKNGKITFEVGDEKMEYSLASSIGSPSKEETIYRVDALDEVVEAKAVDLQLDDSLQMVLTRVADEEDWETREYKRLLEKTRVLAADELIKEVLKPRESKESTTPLEGVVLGHVVSDKGIDVDRAKIEVIEHLPPPILPKAPIVPSTSEGAISSSTSIKRALEKLQNSVDDIKDKLKKLKESLSSMFVALENLNTWMKSQGFSNPRPLLQ
eukprot:XP_015579630.1 uncharacterized protein LOC107261880 [Ricinus communis]